MVGRGASMSYLVTGVTAHARSCNICQAECSFIARVADLREDDGVAREHALHFGLVDAGHGGIECTGEQTETEDEEMLRAVAG